MARRDGGQGALMFINALQGAGQQFNQIQDQQRQAQADALNQQLLQLRIKEQKMQLDNLKLAQDKEKTRLQFKDQFLANLGGNAFQEPTGAGQGAPRGSSLDANTQRASDFAQMDDQDRSLNLMTLANQAGETDLLNSLVSQGFINTPASEQQQRSREATIRSQEATADIQEQSLADNEALNETRSSLSAQFAQAAKGAKGVAAQRLKIASEIAKTADERQLAGLMNEAFPTLDEATSPFQALNRLHGPKKAIEIMHKMDRDNAIAIQNAKPRTPRKFGEAREALAAEMFDGRPFGDLTPKEMAKVNRKVEETRARIAKAGLPTERLPAGAASKMEDIRKLKFTADAVMKQFQPEFVGKFKFAKNKIQILRGTASPELIAFSADYNNLLDMLARERTGAVIGKEEAAQFKQIIGSEFNEPAVFTGRLSRFINNMDMQERTILDINAQSIEELQRQREEEERNKPITSMTNDELLKMWNEAQ